MALHDTYVWSPVDGDNSRLGCVTCRRGRVFEFDSSGPSVKDIIQADQRHAAQFQED